MTKDNKFNIYFNFCAEIALLTGFWSHLSITTFCKYLDSFQTFALVAMQNVAQPRAPSLYVHFEASHHVHGKKRRALTRTTPCSGEKPSTDDVYRLFFPESSQ
jgi:hypothetical protein